MVIEAPLRYPITGIACCCARAASGHAAAPPSSVMNSSLQDGAESAMSIRIRYLLPTRERIMAGQLQAAPLLRRRVRPPIPAVDGDCHTPLPCEVRKIERYHAVSVQS